jgi:hypothetical protein
MDVRIGLSLLISSAFACLPAMAIERTINVPTDSGAKYSIVSIEGSGADRVAIVKRADRYSIGYTKREYDCSTHKTRSLGTASNLEDLNKAPADTGFTSISRGSVTQFIGPVICSE